MPNASYDEQGNAARLRRYRQRRKNRVALLPVVEITDRELGWLYSQRLLETQADKEDPVKVGAALKIILERAMFLAA